MTGLDVCGRDFVMRRARLCMFPTACSASMCWRSNGCTPESFATSPSLVFRKGCLVKLFRRQDSLSVAIRRDGCVFPSYLPPRCLYHISLLPLLSYMYVHAIYSWFCSLTLGVCFNLFSREDNWYNRWGNDPSASNCNVLLESEPIRLPSLYRSIWMSSLRCVIVCVHNVF